MPKGHANACRIGMAAAITTLAGLLLSGPLAVALVEATHPQPDWTDGAAFARHFHPIQSAPYAGGIVLVCGLVFLSASVHALARPAHQVLVTSALVFCAVFACLIFCNYVIQSTFVPVVARDAQLSRSALLAALSMANPKSLAWGLEMWGWGFFGICSWLMSPVFDIGKLERNARWCFAANGPVSLIGSLWTTIQPGWVQTAHGLLLFALWNLLLCSMAGFALAAFRSRIRQPLGEPS